MIVNLRQLEEHIFHLYAFASIFWGQNSLHLATMTGAAFLAEHLHNTTRNTPINNEEIYKLKKESALYTYLDYCAVLKIEYKRTELDF